MCGIGGWMYYSLHYEHGSLVDDREPSRYVKHIQGEVREYVDDDGNEEPIGRFSVYIVDGAAALNEGESLFDVFDMSSSLFSCYQELYGRDEDLKRKVLRAMKTDMTFDSGVLILDRLELTPSRRGRGAGLQILRWMEHQFRMGCGVVVLKPFPLQFEGGTPEEREADEDDGDFKRLELGRYERRFDVALRKLQRHYAKLGFAKVPGTPYMVADPQRRLPRLDPLEWIPGDRHFEEADDVSNFGIGARKAA
eukprot:TRINITY_DN12368_c0_g1_i3.p1 TRINITY_DN12368_c0_g1~~TRINITY_DN12368_c0_g1_i3.p1  ORF type:complete len:251 (+),score=25.01 TRINITY_DN12368_c0_g1_i3:227-979(+)